MRQGWNDGIITVFQYCVNLQEINFQLKGGLKKVFNEMGQDRHKAIKTLKHFCICPGKLII